MRPNAAGVKRQKHGSKARSKAAIFAFERVGRSDARTVRTVRFQGRNLTARLVAVGHADWWPRGRAKPDWCRSH
jgi:hypothetical protein